MNQAGSTPLAAARGMLALLMVAGCAKEPVTIGAVDPRAGLHGALAGAGGDGGRLLAGGRADGQLGEDAAGTGRGAAASQGADARGAAAAGQGTGGGRPDPRAFAPVAELTDIFFEFDRYDIHADSARRLQAHAEWLKTRPRDLVLIEGHCDERGTAEYNLALGERRAKAAANNLVANGVEASRITTISYGKERPSCTDKNESCWAKNRNDTFLTKDR